VVHDVTGFIARRAAAIISTELSWFDVVDHSSSWQKSETGKCHENRHKLNIIYNSHHDQSEQYGKKTELYISVDTGLLINT
jgi:hypothetical protein